MPTKVRLLVVCSLVSMAGCARIPQETVDLSATIGRDVAEMHRAHRELANRYFERMEADVDKFAAEIYQPYIVRKTMADLDLLAEIQKASPLAVGSAR